MVMVDGEVVVVMVKAIIDGEGGDRW